MEKSKTSFQQSIVQIHSVNITNICVLFLSYDYGLRTSCEFLHYVEMSSGGDINR